MASIETELQAEIQKYIADLDSHIINYLYRENAPLSYRNLLTSIISSSLELLDAYKISVNQIFQEHPQIFSRLFKHPVPGNEVLNSLAKLGFNFNAKTSEGESPLSMACDMGCAPVAQFLIQHGATFNEARDGHTPAGVASAHPDFDVSLLEGTTDCKEFLEQYHLIQNSMLLAHRWSINGAGKLGNDIFDKLTYSHPTILRNSLCDSFLRISEKNKDKLFQSCQNICPSLTSDEVGDLITNIGKQFKAANFPPLKELEERIATGEVCAVGFGTTFADGGKHQEGLIFYEKSKFIRVNRGEGSDGRTGIEINIIGKPENIPTFLNGLNPNWEHFDAESFHEMLETQLNLQKVQLIKMKEQSAPTCKWTSEKALFYGVIYCELRSLFIKKGLDEKVADESALAFTRSWYKNITKRDRLDMVKVVLEMFPGKTVSEMPTMIREILYKIYQKSQGKDKYTSVIKLLEEIGMKSLAKLNEQFLEALRKENEDTILNYIERGALGNQHAVDNFDPVLIVLIERGFHKAVKALLEDGTSANPVPPALKSILYAAVKKGDIGLVDLLLTHGADATYLQKNIDELRHKAIQGVLPAGEKASPGGLAGTSEIASLTSLYNQYTMELAKSSTLLSTTVTTGSTITENLTEDRDKDEANTEEHLPSSGIPSIEMPDSKPESDPLKDQTVVKPKPTD